MTQKEKPPATELPEVLKIAKRLNYTLNFAITSSLTSKLA